MRNRQATPPKLTWAQAKRLIKPKFQEAGIQRCELQQLKLTDSRGNLICTGGSDSFAHSMRRNEIAAIKDTKAHNERMTEVVIACLNCHMAVDKKSHKETTNIIRRIIRNRITPVR